MKVLTDQFLAEETHLREELLKTKLTLEQVKDNGHYEITQLQDQIQCLQRIVEGERTKEAQQFDKLKDISRLQNQLHEAIIEKQGQKYMELNQ